MLSTVSRVGMTTTSVTPSRPGGATTAIRTPGTRRAAAATVEPADLQEAVRVVARGEALLSPKATRGLIARFLSQPNPGPLPSPVQLDALTEREREIMALVAAGLSNDETGERLYVSPLTAKTRINRAMMRLGARDRAQLVVLAYRSGLVSPGDLPVL